jgi:hypothetical protein
VLGRADPPLAVTPNAGGGVTIKVPAQAPDPIASVIVLETTGGGSTR